VIPDIIFLRSIYPNIPIIHHLPTFPTSQTSWLREKIEIILFKKTMRLVNGIIAASDKMKDFLINEYSLDEQSIMVCPIFYTSEYFAKKKLLPISNDDHEPHLICTGSTNIAYLGNNVLDKMLEISHKRIHVHCIKLESQAVTNQYLHFFERFDTPEMVSGSLATFMTSLMVV